ncbi:MAG TPA: HD domain-containing phosphohydrolase, partial [Burkholderiales bacterium]|nr:HD domain-containing phosphohydrolase [Burkholderiales bacterium]
MNMVSETPEAQSTFTVLCVDDESNILNALRRLLRPRGYRVLTAESGAEGLSLIEGERVDLVLSDMRMPEMNGAHFLEQVKARSPDTVRILLTGYADLASTVAAVNNGGIYRYIAKPWDDTALTDIVGDALERKRLQREQARLEKLTHHQNEELKVLNAMLEARVKARTAELENTHGALKEAHDKLKKSFFTSVKVFSNLIELREGALAGHSRQVAETARRLAKRMQLESVQMQDVMLGGLLHGIGELGVPDTVLRKAWTALSDEERTVLVRQPEKAQAALMALDQLSQAGKIIRSYRERYDGYGYPDGLRGDAIPLGARILAVAHDYEAAQEGTLTGRWLSKAQAREHIAAGSGNRYDPEVVAAFLKLLDMSGVTPPGEQAFAVA